VSSPRSEGPGPFWLGVAAVVLAVASPIAALCREIAARWRGIVIAHLFFLTLWLAIQVFFFATGAYWCVPSNGPKIIQWLLRSAPRIARCGPVSPVGPLPLSPIVAGPAPLPLEPANPPPAVAPVVIPPAVAPPAVTPASPPLVAEVPAPVPAVPSPVPPAAAPSPAPAAPAAQPPAADNNSNGSAATVPLPPARWSAAAAVPALPRWSAAAIPNCWRDRAVNGGNCYQGDGAVPVRSAPSRARSRAPAYARRPPPTPEQCRRRPWECWPDYGDYY